MDQMQLHSRPNVVLSENIYRKCKIADALDKYHQVSARQHFIHCQQTADLTTRHLAINISPFSHTHPPRMDGNGGLPDSKVHGANMGPIWGRQDSGGPHVVYKGILWNHVRTVLRFWLNASGPQQWYINIDWLSNVKKPPGIEPWPESILIEFYMVFLRPMSEKYFSSLCNTDKWS